MRFKQFITENKESNVMSKLRSLQRHPHHMEGYIEDGESTYVPSNIKKIGFGTHHRILFHNYEDIDDHYEEEDFEHENGNPDFHIDHEPYIKEFNKDREKNIKNTKTILDKHNIKHEFSHDEDGRPTFYVPKDQS